MQLQIKPALRQVWRGPETVQIGLDPRFGMVLDGVTPADRLLLAELGAGAEHQPRDDAAAHAGARDQALLRLLGEAGVLARAGAGDPAPAPIGGARARLAPDAATWSVVHGRRGGDGWDLIAARSGRTVEVTGGGRTGAAVATTLACAGIGTVRVPDDTLVTDGDVSPAAAGAGTVGETRRDAVQAAIARLLRRPPGQPEPPAGTDRAEPPGRPDVVVLVEHGAADALAAQRLVAADLAHLSVVIREGTVVVGPLVLPGSTPCLRCLDLHRTDRDPGWPRILAQLTAERRAPRRDRLVAAPEETASSLLGAALAALQVLGHLDALHLDALHLDPLHLGPRPGGSRPAALGATLEVELPDGLVSRREWPAHPACGCHWPPPAG